MTGRETFTSRTRPVTAIKVIVWGALAVLLYFAHVAFIPVALALLFALVLSSPVEALHKVHIPRSLSAALILIIALSALGGIVALMWAPAQDWFAKAPQTILTIRQKVSPIAKIMNRIDDIRKNATTLSAPGRAAPTTAAVPVVVTESAPALIVNVGASAMAGILAFIIATLFLLTGGPPMMARMTAAFVDNLNSAYVLNIIEKVRAEVGHYYLITTFINVGLGVVTGAAMWGLGMPTPYLWGALAAILNYIPYAGPGTTLLVVTVVAAVSFSTLSPVLAVAGTYLVISMLEGQVVQPLLVGRRMEVNPLLIFLGLWFGGFFWGIAGIILATPTLVALKVIAENTKSGKSMLEFLGPNDQTKNRDAALKRFTKSSR
jgi:predicted PurR-regulated permease PerM